MKRTYSQFSFVKNKEENPSSFKQLDEFHRVIGLKQIILKGADDFVANLVNTLDGRQMRESF